VKNVMIMKKYLKFIEHKFLIIISVHMSNNAIELSFNHGKKKIKGK